MSRGKDGLCILFFISIKISQNKNIQFQLKNGANSVIFINTGVEHDESNASPDEAISWGKIKITASPVKIWADATLVFPLVVAETFAKLKRA